MNFASSLDEGGVLTVPKNVFNILNVVSTVLAFPRIALAHAEKAVIGKSASTGKVSDDALLLRLKLVEGEAEGVFVDLVQVLKAGSGIFSGKGTSPRSYIVDDPSKVLIRNVEKVYDRLGMLTNSEVGSVNGSGGLM